MEKIFTGDYKIVKFVKINFFPKKFLAIRYLEDTATTKPETQKDTSDTELRNFSSLHTIGKRPYPRRWPSYKLVRVFCSIAVVKSIRKYV